MTYRRIAPMLMPDVVPGGADMPEPVFGRARPSDLVVDETYQRNLAERSVRLIRKMVAEWDWRTFMPPVVVDIGGRLHVIDGQHTAIAAASHPKIDTIPIQLVEAPEMLDRAKAFLARNRDRISVTPTQLHFAAVVAGDEMAVTIDQVCKRAGVRILKNPPYQADYAIGDTLSVGVIKSLVDKRGAMAARQVLEILRKAKLAPISAAIIRATEEAIFGDAHRGRVNADDLATVIRGEASTLDRDAKLYSIKNGVGIWRAMVHLLVTKAARRGRSSAA